MMIGIFVSFKKSAIGTAAAVRVPPELSIGGGTSPSGNTNPLPGSYETIALTFELLIAVSQPIPPECECVTRIASPILLNNAEAASTITGISIGPMLGVIERKY